MDPLKMAIGVALIGSAMVAQLRLSRRMVGLPSALRLRVGGVAVVGLCVYFAIAWPSVGVSTWWVLPVGVAAAAGLAWAAYPIVRQEPGA